MSSTSPPSAKRRREARAVGLRPRARAPVLAAIALLGWALLGARLEAAAALSGGLERAFAGPLELDGSTIAGACGAALVVLLGLGILASVGLGPRVRARRGFAIAPEAEHAPGWAIACASLIAIPILAAAGRPGLAGAARAVDASARGLTLAWLGGVRRALLVLAVVALGVGLIEALIAARRLWRALHLTPTQAREQARASARRRP